MVAKINVGTSLYGALAYNGLKVNEGEGKLLAVNKVFDDGSGRVDIARAVEDFRRYMPENVRTRNKVIHISLNPHPDDRLTDMEMEQLAREYLEKLGYGDQPFLIFKHEDINRHHLHIVSVNVDERGRRLNKDFIHRRSKRITTELERKYGLHPADRRHLKTDLSKPRVNCTAASPGLFSPRSSTVMVSPGFAPVSYTTDTAMLGCAARAPMDSRLTISAAINIHAIFLRNLTPPLLLSGAKKRTLPQCDYPLSS